MYLFVPVGITSRVGGGGFPPCVDWHVHGVGSVGLVALLGDYSTLSRNRVSRLYP
jgi:hypothetical protein